MAMNGANSDIPREKDHEHITILRKHFRPVHRLRLDPKATKHETNEEGEDIFVVESGTMTRSEMKLLAELYRHRSPRFCK